MRRPPLTVLAFAVVVAAALLWLLVVGGIYASPLAGGAVLVLATFGLARGLRVAWIFLTIVAVADLVYAVATWPAWGALLVNGALLALLLPPQRVGTSGRAGGPNDFHTLRSA